MSEMKEIPLQWESFMHNTDNAHFLGVKMDFQ